MKKVFKISKLEQSQGIYINKVWQDMKEANFHRKASVGAKIPKNNRFSNHKLAEHKT